MKRWSVLAVVIGVAGCYRVPDDSCAIRCDPSAAEPTCPNGLSCGANSLCYSGTPCSGAGTDAGSTDTIEVDAPPPVDGALCYGAGLVRFCPSGLGAPREISSICSRVDSLLSRGSSTTSGSGGGGSSGATTYGVIGEDSGTGGGGGGGGAGVIQAVTASLTSTGSVYPQLQP